MRLVKKKEVELAIQYDGYNFEAMKEGMKDAACQINHFIDGMLRVDTQHGRLTIRVGEWLVKDFENCYQVYSNDEFTKLYRTVKKCI